MKLSVKKLVISLFPLFLIFSFIPTYKVYALAQVGETDSDIIVISQAKSTDKTKTDQTKVDAGMGGTANPGSIKIDNPAGDSDIMQVFLRVINWLLLVVSLVAVIIIIVAGLTMAFSGGNESRATRGKSMLFSAIIGLVLALTSFAIVNLIQGLLG